MTKKVLLVCGIFSSLYYIAINIYVPMQWDGYSLTSQTPSELSAIGAPTRTLWLWLGPVYTVLLAAFGWGIWISAGGNRPLRVVGGLMLLHAVFSMYWPPMHMRGDEFTLTDALHIVWAGVTVLLMMLSIGFGAAAFGKRFRLYSIVTVVVLIAFGILTGIESPGVAQNLPTPWIGVWERISIAVYMVWVTVLAIALLRVQVERSQAVPAGTRSG